MLTVKNLVVRYGRITALREVSLEVKSGEIVALIGPNGAGKSTTLMAIAGQLRPFRGEIVFEDRSLVKLPPEQIIRRGVALIPEGRRIFNQLSVAENLLIGSTIRKDRAGVKTDLDEIRKRFPILDERYNASAGILSGGEQQQLAIARALLARPKLILLDEPSLGLSPKMTDVLFEIIEELHREGITILMVEQFAARAIEIADRTYIMRNGRIAFSGDRGQLLSQEDVQAAYFGVI